MTKLVARCRLMVGPKTIQAGEIFEYPGDAKKLILRGWAEEPKAKKSRKKKSEPEPEPTADE